MILESIASATLAAQNLGGGYVTVYSGTLAGTDNRNVIATTRITGRGGAATVDISFRVLVGSRLKADETVEYLNTATASLELQSFPFRWGGGQTLSIQVQSSDALDSSCGVEVLIEAERGGVDTAAVQEACEDALAAYDAATAADVAAVGDAVAAAQTGDWSITRTFQVSGGDKVSGVRMSLVGVDGKTDTTGTNGIATIKADDDTFTLRVVTPDGYDDVDDTTVVIDGADDTATVTLTRTSLVPSVIQGAPSASLALRPAMDRKTPLLTLAAVVDHLLLLDEINPAEPRSVDRATKAARDALSSFASYSTQGFRYYESRAKVVMPGTLSLGTIAVSDGVFEVDGLITVPEWAPLAHVRIDRNSNRVYPVLLVNGQFLTVDTLEDGTYSGVYLEQLFFPLPRNFRRRGTLSDGKNNYPVEDMSGGSFQSFQDYYRWIGFSEFDRRFSAITMDQRNQGDLMLSVWPPFAERVELSMFFERYPEAMKHHRVGNSSATLGVTGATATSSHAIFNSTHVGAAITIGTSSDQELLKSLASESLIETQRIIRYVTSSTQVILDTPVDSALANRAFYVSDIVDVQPGVMTEAYKRLAEHELLRQTKGSKADQKLQEFIRQLQMTQADDARYKPSSDPFSTPVGGVQWGNVTGRPT